MSNHAYTRACMCACLLAAVSVVHLMILDYNVHALAQRVRDQATMHRLLERRVGEGAELVDDNMRRLEAKVDHAISNMLRVATETAVGRGEFEMMRSEVENAKHIAHGSIYSIAAVGVYDMIAIVYLRGADGRNCLPDLPHHGNMMYPADVARAMPLDDFAIPCASDLDCTTLIHKDNRCVALRDRETGSILPHKQCAFSQPVLTLARGRDPSLHAVKRMVDDTEANRRVWSALTAFCGIENRGAFCPPDASIVVMSHIDHTKRYACLL